MFFFLFPPVAKRFSTVRPNEYDPGDVKATVQFVQVQTDQNNKNSSSLIDMEWIEYSQGIGCGEVGCFVKVITSVT